MRFWTGYVVGRNANASGGGGGLAVLALVLLVTAAIGYVVFAAGAMIASAVQSAPVPAFVVVAGGTALFVEASGDTPSMSENHAGVDALWFVVLTTVFYFVNEHGYTDTETASIVVLVLLLILVVGLVWSFVTFILGLVRLPVEGRVSRVVRSGAVALIAWSVIAGLASVNAPLSANTSAVAGLASGVIVAVYHV